ncbi:MAG: isocitrate/isopropylmalate dehydrogenase family protein [Chloroflexi bacterium]|nr:isocitrate/isopropylmalate dehydrogenase family protein [Chloroflexota bacterium]
MPQLCVIPGDGIGLEVVPAATAVLQAAIPNLEIIEAEAGWACFQKHGVSVPDSTLATIRACGAALFGAVSSPSRKVAGYRSAILTLRQELDLYANIRPVKSWPRVSPRPGIDMIIVRENTEGLYSGRERVEMGEGAQTDRVVTAVAERVITRRASLRIGLRALNIMQTLNRQKLTIVHKANVLPLTDGLFRDCVREIFADEAQSSAGVTVDELLVDVAALKMVAEPERFDVIVTTNLFGDILSDAAAYWGGGLGLAPSLNWGEACAVAEPVHGSAPDIAGQGIANPMAAILSAALLARSVWDLPEVAEAMETAVARVLTHQPNLRGTMALATAVIAALP